MGEQKRICKPEAGAPTPPELESLAAETVTLVFETDAVYAGAATNPPQMSPLRHACC